MGRTDKDAPTCSACGYDLTGLNDPTCPECGHVEMGPGLIRHTSAGVETVGARPFTDEERKDLAGWLDERPTTNRLFYDAVAGQGRFGVVSVIAIVSMALCIYFANWSLLFFISLGAAPVVGITIWGAVHTIRSTGGFDERVHANLPTDLARGEFDLRVFRAARAFRFIHRIPLNSGGLMKSSTSFTLRTKYDEVEWLVLEGDGACAIVPQPFVLSYAKERAPTVPSEIHFEELAATEHQFFADWRGDDIPVIDVPKKLSAPLGDYLLIEILEPNAARRRIGLRRAPWSIPSST